MKDEQEKCRKLNKNAGFSLVELLIAVTILAIIVIPLLHMFVTSTTVNVKSRQTLRATTVAQDIMEGLKAYDIDELKAQFNNPIDGFYVINDKLIKGGVGEDFEREGDGNGTNTDGDPNPGLYYFTMEGVTLQGSKYDALIEVDARGYMESPSGSTEYDHDQKFNNDQFSVITGVDDGKDAADKSGDAVYRQDAALAARMFKKANQYFYETVDGKTDFDEWDWEKEGWFTESSLMSGRSGAYWVSASRIITIDLRDSGTTDAEGNKIIDATVTYAYEWVRQGIRYPADMTKFVYGENAYGDSIKDHPFAHFTSGRLYLFYYPLYGSPYGSTEDTIVINNEAQIPLQLSIVKQIEAGDLGVTDPAKEIGTKLSDVQLDKAEKDYMATVNILQNSVDDLKIRTNLGYNLVNKDFLVGEGRKPDNKPNIVTQAEFLHNNRRKTDMNIFDLSGVRITEYGAAGADEEITEVIYDIKISVYKEGAAAKGFSDDADRMVVITGSKNN